MSLLHQTVIGPGKHRKSGWHLLTKLGKYWLLLQTTSHRLDWMMGWEHASKVAGKEKVAVAIRHKQAWQIPNEAKQSGNKWWEDLQLERSRWDAGKPGNCQDRKPCLQTHTLFPNLHRFYLSPRILSFCLVIHASRGHKDNLACEHFRVTGRRMETLGNKELKIWSISCTNSHIWRKNGPRNLRRSWPAVSLACVSGMFLELKVHVRHWLLICTSHNISLIHCT